VTHLGEHLAMSALPRVHYDTNASVAMTVTAGPGLAVYRGPGYDRLDPQHVEARGLRLILAADGVALRDPDGDVHLVRWADVVGVERDGTDLTVLGAAGCQVPVDPELFTGAEAVVAAVAAHVPPALRYDRSELFGDDD
jgi:hypothetical protein